MGRETLAHTLFFNMFEKFRTQLARLIQPANNSMNLGRDFLKYGNKMMTPDWTQVVMRDEDLYTGYPYAAIRNRSNAAAQLAINHIKTDSENGDEHPYLKLIESSPTFTDYQFWYNISTYLDLEGVFYLMAIRNFEQNSVRFGAVKEFKLLNPYRVRRVLNPSTLEVAGYVETRGSLSREIPKEMIIEMRELNPFDENVNYAMTDAAKESQFTMKTAGDYTRHTLKHNINAPGILATDIELQAEDFKNFTERIKNNTKGEPIFANGSGKVKWDAMNIDLSKAALGDVNEIQQQQLFSVAGVSKTIMGIEQSGTTRETAKVQKDLMIEGQIIPRIQLIIDALNQDYRNKYPKEYQTNDVDIIVENPTNTDHDADIKVVQLKQAEFDLYTSMVDQGYDPKLVSEYIEGEIDLDELGEPDPTKIKVVPVAPIALDDSEDPEDDSTNSLKKKECCHHNAKELPPAMKRQESYLKNSVINVDKRLVATVLSKLDKASNQYEIISDIISSREKNLILNELETVLKAFYTVNIATEGIEAMKRRTKQLKMSGMFTFDNLSKQYVKVLAGKVSTSHVDAVLSEMLTTTREAALAGLSQKEIVNQVKQKYSEVGNTRATTVARTECLPGETLVDGAVINAIHRRLYKGNMIEIKTCSGRSFSATPNHPMFTNRGWLAMNAIKIGDKLVCDTFNQNITSSGNVDIKGKPAAISEIFDSAKTIGVIERIGTTKPDFHGDGMDGNVDILTPNGELAIGEFAPLNKPVVDDILKSSYDVSTTPFCSRCGTLLEINQTNCFCLTSAKNTIIGENSIDQLSRTAKLSRNFESGHARNIELSDNSSIDVFSQPARSETTSVSGESRDARTSDINPSFLESSSNACSFNSEDLSNLTHRESRFIELDEIISIDVHSFDGYVYNLTTPYGYYTISGAITGNTNRAFTRAQYEADRQFIDQNNLEGRVFKQWRTRSANPCAYCQSLADDGPVPFSDPFASMGSSITVDGSSLSVDFEDLDAGNAHPNCILPDSEVLAPDTQKIIRSNYSGDVVKITTANGRKLTVTPNHIMLTARGWVSAKYLLKTDSIISYSGWDKVKLSNVNPANDNSPATIEKIFAAAVKDPSVMLRSVPVTAKDLKGDGLLCQGDINVISTDSLLRNDTNSSIYQSLRNYSLKSGSVDTSVPFVKDSDLTSMLIALGLTSDGIVSIDGFSDLLSRVNLSTPEFARLFNATSYNSRVNKSFADSASIDPKIMGEFIFRLSSLVTADHVIDIETISYSGHIYDLSTTSTLYISNGLITSNCSCDYKLIIEKE